MHRRQPRRRLGQRRRHPSRGTACRSQARGPGLLGLAYVVPHLETSAVTVPVAKENEAVQPDLKLLAW
jgi:hypothetical protein